MTVHQITAERRARGLPPARPDPMVAPGRMVRLPHGMVGTISGYADDGRLLVRSGDIELPCARADIEPLRDLVARERVRIEGMGYGTIAGSGGDAPWWCVFVDGDEGLTRRAEIVHRTLLAPIGKVAPIIDGGITEAEDALIASLDDDDGRAA